MRGGDAAGREGGRRFGPWVAGRTRERERDEKREAPTLREMDGEGAREFTALHLIVHVHVRVHSWGGKRGNGLQMLCIKHRGQNFNRYITTRSPAALPPQTSKPPSTFLTLLATDAHPHPLQPPLSPSNICSLLSVAVGRVHFT